MLRLELIDYTPKSVAVIGEDLPFFEYKLHLLGGTRRQLAQIEPRQPGYIFPKFIKDRVKGDIFDSNKLNFVTVYYKMSYYNRIDRCISKIAQTENMSYSEVLRILYLNTYTNTPQSRLIIDTYSNNLILRGNFNKNDIELIKKLGGRLQIIKQKPGKGYSFSLYQYNKLNGYLLTGIAKSYREPAWRLTKKEKIMTIEDCVKRLWSILDSIKHLKGKNIISNINEFLESGPCYDFFQDFVDRINPKLDYTGKIDLFYFLIADVNEQTEVIENNLVYSEFTPYEEIIYHEAWDDKYSKKIYQEELEETTLIKPVTMEVYKGYGNRGKNIYIIRVSK